MMVTRLVKVSVIILFLSLSAMLPACSEGRGDWKYDLPNNYRVVQSDADTVVICGPSHVAEQNGTEVVTTFYVGSYVSAFCFSERYVGAQRLFYHPGFSDRALNLPWFYLLDTISGAVYGPFESVEEFNVKCEEMQISDLCDWIATEENPNRTQANKERRPS